MEEKLEAWPEITISRDDKNGKYRIYQPTKHIEKMQPKSVIYNNTFNREENSDKGEILGRKKALFLT